MHLSRTKTWHVSVATKRATFKTLKSVDSIDKKPIAKFLHNANFVILRCFLLFSFDYYS